MPPAFSLRKCLVSCYFQSIRASCAPTCHLPILYQTRTLRIRRYVAPDGERAPRKLKNGTARRNPRGTDSAVAKEQFSESEASRVTSFNHSDNVNPDTFPVEGRRDGNIPEEGIGGGDEIDVKFEKQQDGQKGHYHEQQHQQHLRADKRREWRQPTIVPLEPVTSTLTPGEQNTFAKLFDMAASGKLEQKRKKPPVSSTEGQGMAQQQNDEMKQLAASVLQRHSRSEGQSTPELDISRYPESLRPIVVGKSAGMWENQQEQQRIQQMKSAMAEVGLTGSPIAASTVWPANPNARFINIVKRMSNAKTDVALWETLKSDVFNDFEKLEKAGVLEKQQTESRSNDGSATPSGDSATQNSKKKKGKKKDKQKNKMTKAEKKEVQNLPDVDTFRANYPHLLVVAVQQLRRDFPTSSLALTVLAETKALGLVSYILGASTALYNESLDILWSTYLDLGAVDRLLQEMDNGGIDFDGQTLALLDKIFKDCTNMAGLPEGKMLGFIWRMDKSVREVRQLGEWRDTVRQRLEAEALRMVRERESEADMMATTL